MELDQIVLDLQNRFAAPLPDFYRRRIIFWYDEEREFEEQIGEVSLDHAEVVILTGSNSFAVKKYICEENTSGNILVYCPLSYQKKEDDWLLNVELYSEEFRADLISLWMGEMGLPATPVIRRQLKAYRRFFAAKDRRAKVSALAKHIQSASHMHLAVMAAICGIKELQMAVILRAVLCAGLDNDANAVYAAFENYGADKAFWIMVKQNTGYDEGDENRLNRLAIHLLLTASTRTLRQECLAGLDGFISVPYNAYCYDVVSDWMHGEKREKLLEIARRVEDETRLVQRFRQLGMEDLRDTEVFPCIHEVIAEKLMTDISEHIIDTNAISTMVEKRRTMAWFDDVACYYEGLWQIANMQRFFLDHSTGFHIVEPERVWKAYTEDYYHMDTYYRLFHLHFQKSLMMGHPTLDDLFKQVTDKAEGLYRNWFLGSLAENWTQIAEDELMKCDCISEIPRQESFYASKVAAANSRVFVIISDALRYEVAASLAEQLSRETQAKVQLTSQQAMLPTATKFGMAALLPHKALSAEVRSDRLAILADRSLTDSGYRDKILKAANARSVALQYKNLIKLKRAERSELVKGMDVVYIYHDTIDEASHTSDSAVFAACEDTIAEIKNMARIIVNEFSGTHILITADHGFLYTYSPLKEDDKVDKAGFDGKDVEIDRRYVIMQKGASPDNLLPVCFLNGKTDFDAFVPRENTRIKTKGGGLNYVHGGISLQEMVVPIIEYHYVRTDTKAYQKNKAWYDTRPVELGLISASRKITNMVFSLSFLQKEAVSDNREKATYSLCFVDATGKAVSDTQRIIADKTTPNAQERAFRCNFSLKSMKFDKLASYYLVIADEAGTTLPQREEFQIDIAFAVDDFNFFE